MTTTLLPERIEDDSWSFRGEFSSGYTHRFHSYPAMMLPQIARRLLALYGHDGATVLDPFCGSGSVLVEANLAGCNAWGFDLNPLAVLIAQVKTRPLPLKPLEVTLERLLLQAACIRDPEAPEFFNLDYWFKPKIVEALSCLRRAILDIEEREVRDFFAVVYSEVVRLSSNSRAREFKLYRYSPDRLAVHNPDPFVMFKVRALRNIEGMRAFHGAARRDRFVRPLVCNTMLVDARAGEGPASGSIDLVVTSPPYGDSRTTVAYGQFSRLSLQFMGSLCGNGLSATGKGPRDLDRQMLGGSSSGKDGSTINRSLASSTLDAAVDEIAARDAARGRDVLAFYSDFSICLRNVASLVAPAGVLCFVVGNRRVKGIQLDTDYIIAEMGAQLGLVAESIVVRSIPAKRMPLRNSPSNRPGEVGDTMHREYILTLRRR